MAMHYFFSKSDEWIYEKEFRFILPFHAATHITYSPKKAPRKIASKLPTNTDNALVIPREDGYVTIFTEMIDLTFLSEMWVNSKEYDIIFTILINDSCIKNLFIGNNCDTNKLKKHISDKVNIDLASWPYLNFYDPVFEEFRNILKSTTHPDRYELIFKKVKNRS